MILIFQAQGQTQTALLDTFTCIKPYVSHNALHTHKWIIAFQHCLTKIYDLKNI